MSNYKSTESKIKKLLKGRTVLVTGASGFVGSHLTEKLLEYKPEVHVLVRPTSSGILHNIRHLQDKIIVHKADITDKQAIRRTLLNIKKHGSTRPSIFHIAAQSHVGESWWRPYETIDANILGTLNILQTIIDIKLKPYKVSFAGSSEEYGNVDPERKDFYRFDKKGGLILDEKSPLFPQSIYAVSKVAGDFLFRDFYRAYGLPCVIARKFNNYGPRQNPRFITGTIITQGLSRKKVIELGYLEAKRDFTYVKDGAMGHIHVNLFGKPGEVYCFGSGKTISMEKWYNLIIKLGQKLGYWGKKELRTDVKSRGRLGKSEVEELRVDYSKLHKKTGWKPVYSWQEGLKETIKWYATHKKEWIDRVDWK